MSFLAHLFINQRKIRVLRSRVRFYQHKDMTGKPEGRVNGGIIHFTIELTGDSDLLHQMMNAEQMVEGYFRFYKRDGMSKLYDYEFFDTHVFYYRVHQTASGKNPAMIDIGFSCGILRIGSAVLKKPWHVTDLEAEENPDYEGGERIETIVRQYLTDQEGNEIQEYVDGDTIILNIETENMHKKRISVKLDDAEHDFKHKGQVLENDTIKNLEIVDDLMQIVLEVVPQKNEE